MALKDPLIPSSFLADAESGLLNRSEPYKFKFNWRAFWKFTGPGWLMSLAYLDPGNLEADLQQGAYTNYTLVWVLFWSTVIGLILQELSSRLGVATGKDLAENAKECYTSYQSKFLYVMMELAIVGSDIQEVLGSAIAIYLLSNHQISLVWGCLITGLDTFTFLFIHKCGARVLEAAICALILTMAVTFFINWAEVPVNVGDMLQGGVLPFSAIKSYAVMQAVGTIGAVIMPHNLYLHSGLVLSRGVNPKDVHKVWDASAYFFIEAAVALAFSFLINLAIVSTFAEFFFDAKCAAADGGPYACMPLESFDDSADPGAKCGAHEDFYCGEIGLDTAGSAIANKLPDVGETMWALGLLAAGQASTMTATLAGQMVMGGFLDWKITMWMRVAITRAFALGPAVIVCLATANNSTLTNDINEWLNILQSVQLPYAMFPLLMLAGNTTLMGVHALTGAWKKVCWAFAWMILCINFYLIIDFVYLGDGNVPNTTSFKVFMGIIMILYAVSVVWIVMK